MRMDPPALATIYDGYRSQLGNGDDGVLRLLSARLDVLALQLATMAVNGLVGMHLLTRPDQTGRPAEPALLRDLLREVQQHVANTRRGFDRVVDALRAAACSPTRGRAPGDHRVS